jgi:hypothetical protein
MGILTRLFGGQAGAAERSARLARSANLQAPVPGKPTFAEAVPAQVMVAFHAHREADGLPGNFLTAVTRGLVSSGQRELALTLRLADRELPVPKMQELVRFFTTVSAWAEAGTLVEEGGLTQFGERGLFGQPHCGLLYTEARPIAGVELPERALAAIFVQPLEVRAALDYGTYRVLTRIAAQLRIFPLPTWGAIDRPSAIAARESESTLAKLGRLKLFGASFLVAEQCLRLTIPRSGTNLGHALNSLPADASFALLTRPDPSANALLTWRPGQPEMTGICPEGSDRSRSSGCFLMFVPSAAADEARVVEDGYSLRLSSESRARLLAALVEQLPLSLTLAEGILFVIEWR